MFPAQSPNIDLNIPLHLHSFLHLYFGTPSLCSKNSATHSALQLLLQKSRHHSHIDTVPQGFSQLSKLSRANPDPPLTSLSLLFPAPRHFAASLLILTNNNEDYGHSLIPGTREKTIACVEESRRKHMVNKAWTIRCIILH